MMKLSDTAKNTQFLYLYIKDFKWENVIDTEKFHGHPKSKRVYRAALNSDTNGYRLFYKPEDSKNHVAIIIHHLMGYEGGYTSDIVELTKQNILDLEITESDLDSLIEWQGNSNADLKKMYGFDKPAPQTIQILGIDEIREMVNRTDEQEKITEFINSSSELHDIDGLTFDSIHMIIDHLLESQPEDSSFDAINITTSKEHGAGHNVGKALNLLSVYLSENQRVSLDVDDLLGAINHLITELNRRILHGIE